jgi:hypothetical protein
MRQKTFSRVAGALFLLVAFGHLLRIAFGASVVVQNVSIPMWVSVIALVITVTLHIKVFGWRGSLYQGCEPVWNRRPQLEMKRTRFNGRGATPG